MKETVHANIGSQAFILDADAFDTLKTYLNDIHSRLPGSDTETMDDIEARLAEIFRERIGCDSMRVVTIGNVREAMVQMGTPSDFGERCGTSEPADGSPSALPSNSSRRLYRSRADRSIAGVCGGLAEFFRIDPTLLRLITLLLILFGGLSVWIYIILWIVVPEEPRHKFSLKHKTK